MCAPLRFVSFRFCPPARALSMFSTMTLFTSLMSPLTRVMASADGLLEKYSICWWSTRENSVLYAYASA